MDNRVGAYSFMVGVIIAVILGLFSAYITGPVSAILVSLLVIAGLVVGFVNVTGKETKEFLTVGTILAIVAYVGGSANLGMIAYNIGPYLVAMFNYVMVFVVPAIIVVGLKDIVRIAKTA
jgi:hypothetical protein